MAELDLVIDAGHGGSDPGAVKGNRLEKDWTLRITNYQLKRFKELGFFVEATRTSDRSIAQGDRVAHAKKANYCISNHLNAGGGNRAEVIHSIHSKGELAHKIAKALIDTKKNTVNVYNRAGVKGDYYYMHRLTGKTETNIVEYCFLDNEADFKDFESKWETYAEAVVKAFCEHVGKRYKPPESKQPSKPASKPAAKDETFYRVVTGSFKDKENAENRVKELKKQGHESFIELYKK